MKEKKGKRSLLYVIILLVLLLVVTGISYVVFSLEKTSTSQKEPGQIKMTYEESSNAIELVDALPMEESAGIAKDYFEFKVTTTASTNKKDDVGIKMPYEINISLQDQEDKQQLPESYLRLYLVMVNDDKETMVANELLSSLTASSSRENAKVLANITHEHKNGNKEITSTYRLRSWIDSSTTKSSKQEIYTYKFLVNVNSSSDVTQTLIVP